MSKKEKLLTVSLLNCMFVYSDGFLYWKKDGYNNIHKAGDFAGTFNSDGYYIVAIHGDRFLGHRIIFFMHKRFFPKNVDHIDRDKSNCRIGNLREATSSENSKNVSKRNGLSSQYLGVCYKKQTGKWVVRIRIGYPSKNLNIGYFFEEIDAALAYNRAAVLHHGEFANLNIIKLV